MNTPRKAIILAAGLGVRMQPITRAVPKPLLPFWGRPAIDHILEMLETWGVRDVLINLHHAAPRMVDHLRGRAGGRLRIALSFEPQVLGTGGALVKASWFLDDTSPFWVVNADIAIQGVQPGPFIAAMERPRTLAVLWLKDGVGPQSVECHAGRITSFRTGAPGRLGTYTFAGLHLVSPRVIRFLPGAGPATIIDAYDRSRRAGFLLRGVVVPGAFWADLGTPRAFLDAHRAAWELRGSSLPGSAYVSTEQQRRVGRLRRRGVRTRGFVSLGEDVRVRGTGTISESVLFDRTSLEGAFEIDRAVIAPSALVVGRRVSGVATCAGDVAGPGLLRALQHIGWPAGDTLALPLPPRGSARTFMRLCHGPRSIIAVEYSIERAENALYASQARFLRTIRVPVPRILYHDARSQVILMEDAGETSLADIVQRHVRPEICKAYRAAIPGVARLHLRGARAALRRGVILGEPFGSQLYRWEHDLCITHLLNTRMRMDPARFPGIRVELERNARRLDTEPCVLIHRDLQSSNVLFGDRGALFIDFQGMRLGPAVYDLASFLCDPYVSLDSALQLELVSVYARAVDRNAADVLNAFWPAAVQRLVQALGAYARLAALPGMGSFANHIPPALDMLDRSLQFVDPMPRTRAWVRELRKGDHP